MRAHVELERGAPIRHAPQPKAGSLVSFAQIKAFADRVARLFKPQKIVLFGSYAYGRPTPDSDVDLLVIMPFNRRQGSQSLAIRLAVDADFALDLLVEQPKAVQQRLGQGDFFLKEILSKGRVLYEK